MQQRSQYSSGFGLAYLWKAHFAFVVALMLTFAMTSTAYACLACISMPSESLADKVFAADAVVLLREDPDNPFRFAVVSELKGSVAEAEPVPFLVDGATRRKLNLQPGDGVIATWSADIGWTRLDYAGAGLQEVVLAVLDQAEAWDADAAHEERFVFFAALHDHPDPSVQQLALIELARVPYPQLSQMQPNIHRQEVASKLADMLWVEWAPIYIVLLGLSDDPQDQAFVRRAMASMMRSDSRINLIPWTTALIEVDGIRAIAVLEESYFGESPGDPGEIRDIGMALANHATTGNQDVQNRIALLFHEVAGDHPDLAAVIAGQLLTEEDWSQADIFESFLEDGLIADPGDAFVLTSYVANAREALSASHSE